MSVMKKFKIVDRVTSHDTVIVEAANGRSALKKYQQCLMNTGIYEIILDKGRWHLVSSFGCDFEAVPETEKED